MAPLVPTSPPTEVRAGASWLWDDAYPDFPASEGWSLSFELRGTDAITLSGSVITANGDGWHVIVPATSTAGYAPDSYEFVAVLTGSGTYAGRIEVVTLPRLLILPNLVAAGPGDRIAWVQTQLEQVEAAIAARIKGDEPEFYSVDATSAKRTTLQDLLALRIRLKTELAQLRAPQQFGRQINHRFVRASA